MFQDAYCVALLHACTGFASSQPSMFSLSKLSRFYKPVPRRGKPREGRTRPCSWFALAKAAGQLLLCTTTLLEVNKNFALAIKSQ